MRSIACRWLVPQPMARSPHLTESIGNSLGIGSKRSGRRLRIEHNPFKNSGGGQDRLSGRPSRYREGSSDDSSDEKHHLRMAHPPISLKRSPLLEVDPHPPFIPSPINCHPPSTPPFD